jgi:hypothetical protein
MPGPICTDATAGAWSINNRALSELTLAGHAGHVTKITPNHCSSMPLHRRGLEYYTDPSWATSPNLPTIGMDSGPLALKH